MRLAWLTASIAALILGSATPAWSGATSHGPRPVSGAVTSIDEDDRVIYVEQVRFVVPPGVYDLEELEEGVRAIVTYHKGPEGRVADDIRIETRGR